MLYEPIKRGYVFWVKDEKRFFLIFRFFEYWEILIVALTVFKNIYRWICMRNIPKKSMKNYILNDGAYCIFLESFITYIIVLMQSLKYPCFTCSWLLKTVLKITFLLHILRDIAIIPSRIITLIVLQNISLKYSWLIYLWHSIFISKHF